MSSKLYSLLDSYRQSSRTNRELGTYFEELGIAYFENDDIQKQFYDKVWTYADWVEETGLADSKADVGIDLVARLKDSSDDYCAIQCKFYEKTHKLQRKDLDSFFSASSKKPFVRRILIDTTDVALGKNAQEIFDDKNQYVESQRISLSELEKSRIDWDIFAEKKAVVLKAKKTPRRHQLDAIETVNNAFRSVDRGKMIMACGTGKTYTGLKIAKTYAGKGKRVLFMVPSLALMSQTVTEWCNDAEIPLRCFAVCSDVSVGKRKSDDIAELNQHDLAFPATTDGAKIAREATPDDPDAMTVVFSTYQSIQALTEAQKVHGLPEFDLIICDEAHRTTGATLAGEDDSNFVRIHHNEYVEGKKRLYMTATPRIFGEGAKGKADDEGHTLASMDDEKLFGHVLFSRDFTWAVENDLLTDYKVIVLAMDEGLVSRGVQNLLSSGENELQLDDASRIVGCYKALTKSTLKNEISYDAQPMKRALAFCKDIKASKLIEAEFSDVTEEYLENTPDEPEQELHCSLHHVDGTFNAKERNKLLDWLKDEPEDDECRILTNARCLSEGVDVPALDAIMFLHPRKSQIDVVQSVGRVMRKAEGKKMGYVILPIGVPSGVSPEEALNDNEKYKVVWQILNALRAHDERVDATINKAGLGEDISDRVQIVGVNADNLKSVTAVVEDIPTRDNSTTHKGAGIGTGGSDNDDDYEDESSSAPSPTQTGFNFNEEISNAIIAQIVKKCGTRDYWEDWAKDIAEIAQKHIARIKATLDTSDSAKAQFNAFLKELRDDLNDSITEDETIEMLAQHLITRPVFETLFEGHTFTRENQVSSAIQKVLDVLDEHSIDKESKSLKKFYASVKRRAKGIETSAGKQRLVVELYDKFFRSAFPRLTEKLGIVYTPVEVVDFIIHSVNDVLQNEFGQSLGSKGVHIIDPFTGTGTFITRLLQSGVIKPEELEYKFKNEIHANEIVLLAYYIAGINIEAVYHDLQKEAEYTPFEGICLTDTFQMYEQEDMIQQLLAVNSERRVRQKSLPLKVIIGNPPYSAGQSSANDNNANQAYPCLDESIRTTYAANTTATNKNALYDSYIRAIRWGSDRLGEQGGVMAYVSNATWIEGSAMDGLRKCLSEEYSSIYIFHLRGNQRTQGELSRKEGGKIFGSGSRAPISITVFVKNPQAEKHGQIYFHDIGDYLTQKEKLSIVEQFGSVNGITNANDWTQITPDGHNDWLNQRDTSFREHIVLGDKKDKTGTVLKLFSNYSRGLETGRDSWCYNSSESKLVENMQRTINLYNSEVDRYALNGDDDIAPKDFVNNDATQISWTSSLYPKLKSGVKAKYRSDKNRACLYRPYSKQIGYYDSFFNHRVGQLPNIFTQDNELPNKVIIVTGNGAANFSCLISSRLTDLNCLAAGAQSFPLKIYEPVGNSSKNDLFADLDYETVNGYNVKDGITDEGLAHFQQAYPNETITKEDIFYYVYGLLHSEDYRERYADNLSKELPRIPRVKEVDDFWSFVEAGRKLGDLHVNYEDAKPYPVELKLGSKKSLDDLTDDDYRVDKKWAYLKKADKTKDFTQVKYNKQIIIAGIPEEAYEYMVNGRPALEWVMERQMVKTDKASGIVNDANDFAIETMGNPKYPLELFQKVITVSLETMKIVRSLPKLNELYEG